MFIYKIQMKNKLIQKNLNKQNKQNLLPIVLTQQSLKPDTPIPINTYSVHPLNINQIQTKIIKDSQKLINSRKIIENQQISRSSAYKHYINHQKILEKLILSNLQLQRLSNQFQKYKKQFSINKSPNLQQSNIKQLNIIRKQYQQLKEKYDILLIKNQQGQKSIYDLNLKYSQVQHQLKKKNQIEQHSRHIFPTVTFGPITNQQQLNIVKKERQQLIGQLNSKQNEIKIIQAQLKLLKQEVFKIKSIQNEKKRLGMDINNQIKLSTQQINIQKNKLSIQLNRQNQQNIRIKNENGRMFEQLNVLKHDNIKMREELNRNKGQINYLKQQLSQKQILKMDNENLIRQIQIQKQNVVLYANECHRLANELLSQNNLRQKQKKELNDRLKIQNERQNQQRLRFYREQVTRLQRQNDRLKQKIQQIIIQNKNENERVNIILNDQKHKYEVLQSEYFKLQKQSKMQNPYLKKNRLFFNEDNKNILYQQKYETLCQDYERLRRSKQDDIRKLNQQINKLKQQNNQKQVIIKQFNQKMNQNNIIFQNQQDNQLLKKHLELSVKQIKQLYDISKVTNQQLMKKVQQYHAQKIQINKKNQYQHYQLNKLYQLLETRRQQLQTCYRTIQNLRKGQLFQNTSLLNDNLTQLLHHRRQQLY